MNVLKILITNQNVYVNYFKKIVISILYKYVIYSPL